MDTEAGLSVKPVKEICTIDAKPLRIKIATAGKKQSVEIQCQRNSLASSPYGSPLISPPSTAFASALQSTYISPRATLATNSNPKPSQENSTLATTFSILSPPGSYSGSLSDDVPPTPHRQNSTLVPMTPPTQSSRL